MKTINGYDRFEVIKELQNPLPNGGYKQHPTKKYLTTINPAHTRERITDIFGLAGLGWGLDWNTEDTDHFVNQTSSGKDRHNFVIYKAMFWYVMIDDEAKERICYIPTSGHSDNDNIGDAVAGARTSCISTAIKELLFQLHVYKDEKEPPPQIKSTPKGATKPTVGDDQRKPSEAMLKKLHAAGNEVYGDEWDEKRTMLIESVTGGRSNKTAHLTFDECKKLIDGIEAKRQS